ncbi:related to MNN4 Regulates the mannosylphosphorylation [Phialocephala subalpina]|uniref:Related to MNN4 Regulates the mannosylphosphorylation n=1 Tax=Phialocephala subalpina TaxID=576137 RepID=A0A1L7X1N0_9HELO|nr:related to MNN4 Regulates the mannosylphosphorylation [Phialocephala subalpina]
MTLSTVDERRRRNRNIVLSAFLSLIIIWTIKLCYPQHTLLSIYQSSQPTLETPPTAAVQTTTSPADPVPTGQRGEIWHAKPKDSTILGENIFNGSLSNKAAVIVETRFRTNLVPLILHFSSVLGPTWPILIYTSPESVGQFSSSAALARYLKMGIIQVRMLPQEVLFTNSDSVNAFMTKKWLWEDLEPAEHILIFQSDSMLCANAARSVDDYFQYDFVGAPIAAGLGVGYNGGLSLRKRSTTLRVLEEWDWEETKTEKVRFEDQWYYDRMLKLQKEDYSEDGAQIELPSMEVARTFSVETIDYPHPLGVHQVHRWLKEQMLSLDKWCPEYQLCSVDHIIDT